jgi:hypothetical protein
MRRTRCAVQATESGRSRSDATGLTRPTRDGGISLKPPFAGREISLNGQLDLRTFGAPLEEPQPLVLDEEAISQL